MKPKLRFKTMLILGGALVGADWAQSACVLGAVGAAESAETSTMSSQGGGLAEIVVTAERRAQSIQDVPSPVTAVQGETLENLGIDTVKFLPAATPGISISAQSASVVPYISGIGTKYAL